MNTVTIGRWVVLLLAASVLLFGLTQCSLLIIEEQKEKVVKAEVLTEKYNVPIQPWQETKCLNGWLMVKVGVHAWVYPRDELFDPIQCE